MQGTRTKLNKLLILLVLAFSATVAAQQQPNKLLMNADTASRNAPSTPATIWRNADNVGSLNLLYGAGGQAQAPDLKGKFTFLKEVLEGSNPKFDVQDEQGMRWRVKMGKETHSEVAAARLLWAAGYFVDVDYYVPELKVTGMPKLRRGGKFVSKDGTVHGARLERKPKGVETVGTWGWYHNPFLEKRNFNGLRVMMSLLNNWDLKEANNSIQETGGQQSYVITDLGATFGKTGSSFTRSRGVLKDYENSKFIRKITAEHVDFVMHSRPLFLTAILPYYYRRARMEQITRQVPLADAKWLGQILGQLSADQIRDCFRAGGYTPAEVEGYTKVVQKRIAQLNAL